MTVDPAAQRRALVLLGVLLASVGGFVDGVGYLLLNHVFVAHQSGNTVASMVGVGTGDWSIALRRGVPIALFVLGVALGAAVLEVAGRRHIASLTSLTLGAEALLLVGCLVAGASVLGSDSASAVGFWSYLGLVVLLVFAMGLQTATLRRIGRRTVRTTYVTGMLTHFAEEAVAVLVARGEARRDPVVRQDPARAGELRERGMRLRLLGAIRCCYAVGGVLGALAEARCTELLYRGPIKNEQRSPGRRRRLRTGRDGDRSAHRRTRRSGPHPCTSVSRGARRRPPNRGHGGRLVDGAYRKPNTIARGQHACSGNRAGRGGQGNGVGPRPKAPADRRSPRRS